MAFTNRIIVEAYDQKENEQGKYLIQGIDDVYWTNGQLDAANIVQEELVKIGRLGDKNIFTSKPNQSVNNKSTATFDQIIKNIKQIIGDDQFFKLEFYSGEIAFCVYESEVVISYISRDNDLYLNCESNKGRLGIEEICDLNLIMIILDENKELLRKFC